MIEPTDDGWVTGKLAPCPYPNCGCENAAPTFTESDLLEVARRAVHEYPNGRSSDELIAEVVRDFIKEREAT